VKRHAFIRNCIDEPLIRETPQSFRHGCAADAKSLPIPVWKELIRFVLFRNNRFFYLFIGQLLFEIVLLSKPFTPIPICSGMFHGVQPISTLRPQSLSLLNE
jgi:hypothetical protein